MSPRAAPEVVVEQAIDLLKTARFRKQVREVRVETGSLGVVRKRGDRGGRRGAVLLVHGYAQNHYSWHVSRRSFANYLADAGFDVFNLDLRGVGRSRALGSPPARDLADYVESDLPAAVRDALEASGERSLFLLGHSLGAAAACAFAGCQPDVVRGLVMLAGLYDFARASPVMRLLGRAAASLATSGGVSRLLPDPVPTDLIGRMLDASRVVFDSPMARLFPLRAWAPGSVEPEVLSEAIRRSFEPAPLGLTLDLARMAAGEGPRDRQGRGYLGPFEQADVPLLVVSGREDPLASPEDSTGAWARSRSRDKSIRRFDSASGGVGWGHMDILLGRNAPHHVWPFVRDWLAAR